MFVITEQAMAELEKGRKRRERERLGQADEAASAAHAAAQGFQHVMATEPEGNGDSARDASMLAAEPDGDSQGDGIDDDTIKAAAKSYAEFGVIEGPSRPVRPGQVEAQDFTRGYIEAGHAADAPGNPPGLHSAHVPHIDLTASRGHLTPISPTAPMGPGGLQ
jgi:hypothetical protein